MDQNPLPSSSYSVFQTTTTAVICQVLTSQNITPTVVSPSTNNYLLTSSNLRPVTNYTLVASSQVPLTHHYVVQSTTRTTIPQYVNTSNMRHVLSSSTQPTNVTYMFPSGTQIVRMNDVITTTIAGDQRPSTQFILTSSSQKSNPNNMSPLGSQPSKSNSATITENTPGSSGVQSRTIGVTTSSSPIYHRPVVSIPKSNAAYYSQIKGNESQKISFRPKLNEQKSGTSFILSSNDWPRSKNVPISNLQKMNTNNMQIPSIPKSGTVLSTNTSKLNDSPQPRPQHQTIRSVIFPSNYRTASVSPQKGTDCKLVLNSLNVPTQVLNSNDIRPSTSSITVSNTQQSNPNFMQIPTTQKQETIFTYNNSKPDTENNICLGHHQTIRSIILPSNYRTTMVSSPQKGVDYRLILKPVNIQSPILRNLPSSKYTSPRNTSVRNSSPRQSTPSVRPNPLPSHVLLTRPSPSRVQNEVIANSKITPIPLRKRKSQLVISERSIQICIDEINSQQNDLPNLIITESAMKLVQAEVTYRLFYLLRECKKVLLRSRSNVLTEEAVKQICSEYFVTFYGNKLWPLFCLKPNTDINDDNIVWMRKHNNVNLVGWLKHPKFRDPSFIRKRLKNNLVNKNMPLSELMNVSEVVYEYLQPTQINEPSLRSPQSTTRIFYQSLKNNQVPFINMFSKNGTNHNQIYNPMLKSSLKDDQPAVSIPPNYSV